jgi:hypothetical protein
MFTFLLFQITVSHFLAKKSKLGNVHSVKILLPLLPFLFDLFYSSVSISNCIELIYSL